MTSKPDPEPYFARWNSVIVLASPNDQRGQARYQHKTCKALVPVPANRVPPKTCPECGASCVTEAREEEKMKQDGAVLLGKPEAPMQLRKESFSVPPFSQHQEGG